MSWEMEDRPDRKIRMLKARLFQMLKMISAARAYWGSLSQGMEMCIRDSFNSFYLYNKQLRNL